MNRQKDCSKIEAILIYIVYSRSARVTEMALKINPTNQSKSKHKTKQKTQDVQGHLQGEKTMMKEIAGSHVLDSVIQYCLN